MISIRRYDSDIVNLYTYFEFETLDQWEDFDFLVTVLTEKLDCKVLKKIDGIYSRYCELEQKDFLFKLMYHEDFGNCLYSQDKKDEVYYKYLERIVNSVVAELNSMRD